MSRHTLLQLPSARSLRSLLEALVACTNERQGAHRPQVTTLKPITVEPRELPAFIEAHDCTVGLIYGEDSTTVWPEGELLLWIRFRPVPQRGYEQGGRHYGEIVVDVWRNELYPLSQREVEWFIARFCGCTGHQWQQLPVCWQSLQSICAEDSLDASGPAHRVESAPAADGENDAATVQLPTPKNDDPPSGAQHNRTSATRTTKNSHRSGKPRTETTKWLQEQIAALPNINDYDHLYNDWLKIYWQMTGAPPRNPYNSFKQTADSCVQRLLEKRLTS